MPEPRMDTARQRELAGPPRTELDKLLAEYGARWRCWQGRLTGTYYAIRADRQVRGAYQLHADTPATLREQICRAEDQDLPITFLGAATARPADNAGISDRPPMPEPWMYAAGQRELTGPLRDELDELLDEHGADWHVAGPCLDGSWYAWPRGRDEAPRLLAPSLAELGVKLKERGAVRDPPRSVSPR
ncbi:MAG: hypothetical protein ACRDNF_19910 [Streptosporangiaceae bacterium]